MKWAPSPRSSTHAHGVVRVQRAERLGHLAPEVRAQGVALAGAGEHQLGDALRLLDAQRVVAACVHAPCPPSGPGADLSRNDAVRLRAPGSGRRHQAPREGRLAAAGLDGRSIALRAARVAPNVHASGSAQEPTGSYFWAQAPCLRVSSVRIGLVAGEDVTGERIEGAVDHVQEAALLLGALLSSRRTSSRHRWSRCRSRREARAQALGGVQRHSQRHMRPRRSSRHSQSP